MPKSIDKLIMLWYNNYRKLRKEVITMRETYYINGKTYVLRFYNGIHRVECEGRVAFEGWYEKCRAFLKDLEVAHIESLL